MTETITGEVVRVTYESEETSFRVLQVAIPKHGPLTAVGRFQFVAVGVQVRMTGERVRDPKHGEQFRVHTMITLEPNTLPGLEKYLGSGLIPGIGAGLAKRIVKHFGLETLHVLDTQPERLRQVTGLGKRRRQDIVRHWKEQREIGNLNLLLQTHGISSHLARRIHEKYGERSAEIVQTNPYRLAMEVPGVGFKTADAIASTLGISRDHPERAQAGVFHQLQQISDSGHVFARRDQLAHTAAALLEIDLDHVESAIDALWAAGRCVVERVPGDEASAGDAVFPKLLHRAEVALAERIVALLQIPAVRLQGEERALAKFEKDSHIELAPEQKLAVRAAAEHKFVIITGGPGVGKTTIVRAVLSVFDGARLTTRLAAPTGRAAKRLSESTGRPASTLHRLLEYDPLARQFSRCAQNPLEAQAVIVDEASMIDLQLAEALLDALPERARLVIVGDADQLPSVGPGAVLRDLIQSGVAQVVALTRIFRQANRSMIIDNAHAILAGELPIGAEAATTGADFFIIPRSEPEEAANTIEELVLRRIPQRFGLDPMNAVQVLSPMHRGPAGTVRLNERLQAALNPSGSSLVRRDRTYRVGDRVMQLKNDYTKEVFNGDQGRIVHVDDAEGTLAVEFDGRVVEYAGNELDLLTLAYATSIHKSQGSEYPAVIIPLLTSHFVMLSRNLLYTAVTRARTLCVLVADPKAISIALSEVRKEQRNTGLESRLRELLQ